nr:hypothetical protein [Tanacetum cinerariifolium]
MELGMCVGVMGGRVGISVLAGLGRKKEENVVSGLGGKRWHSAFAQCFKKDDMGGSVICICSLLVPGLDKD